MFTADTLSTRATATPPSPILRTASSQRPLLQPCYHISKSTSHARSSPCHFTESDRDRPLSLIRIRVLHDSLSVRLCPASVRHICQSLRHPPHVSVPQISATYVSPSDTRHMCQSVRHPSHVSVTQIPVTCVSPLDTRHTCQSLRHPSHVSVPQTPVTCVSPSDTRHTCETSGGLSRLGQPEERRG